MRNPRVKLLFDRWRKVWLLAFDRQRKLKEAIDRLKEVCYQINKITNNQQQKINVYLFN